MNIFSLKFTNFIIKILKPLLFIMICVSFGTIFAILLDGISFIGVISVIIAYLIIIFISYKTIRSNLAYRKKLIIVLMISFVIRLLWLLNVKSIPISDFKIMYEAAGSVLKGDFSMFWGTGYIARFPHLTIMVLYMALMKNIFPVNNLIAMKFVNLCMGVVVVLLIYLIVKEIFKNKKYALYAALGAATLPSLVTYVGVFCSENIAIPFYLLSIYLFLKGIKVKNGITMLLLSGVSLGIGNLFRTVATVVLIAYVLYIIIYFRGTLIRKLRSVVLLVVPFFIILLFVSQVLHEMKIIENTLSRGSEPNITNVLKGTNFDTNGRWNEEDARLPADYNYDYDKINEKSKEIIIDRLTNTNPIKLVRLYLVKFSMQWNEGDNAGVFWSQLDVPEEDIVINISGGGRAILQIGYVAIIVLVFLGTLNREELSKIPEINLIYLILCGYGTTYLITESQSRYSYIICWVFIILAIPGIDYILKKRQITKNKLEE